MATSSATPASLGGWPPSRAEFAAEASQWVAIAAPAAFTSLLDIAPWLVTLVFVGRLSTADLAALSLVETVMYTPLFMGWAAVANSAGTLISQSHGARNVDGARGWALISSGWMLVIGGAVAALWLNASRVLVAAGYDAASAEHGQLYATTAVGCLFFESAAITAGVYLSSLEMAVLPMAISVVACTVDVLASYALIFGRWGAPAIGLRGAAYGWMAGSGSSTLLSAGAVWWSVGRELDYGFGDDEEAEEKEKEGRGGGSDGEGGAGGAAVTDEAKRAAEADAGAAAARDGGDAADSLLVVNAAPPPVVAAPSPAPAAHGFGGALRWALSLRRQRAFAALAGPNFGTVGLELVQLLVISLLAARLGAVDIAVVR